MSQIVVGGGILLLLVIAIGIVSVGVKALLLKLPDQQRLALEQFVTIAVKQIEQQHSEEANDAKKILAIETVQDLFIHFHLPVPPPELIDIAIEAACFELKLRRPTT